MITAARPISEKAFQTQVESLARLYGWRYYHTWQSIRSVAGFPDLVLVKPPRVLFAELKAERGVLSQAQLGWLVELGGCSGVETFVWRPSQFEEIRSVLAGEL